MAKPIAFTPPLNDPKADLMRRLATAPIDHAAAMLAALDLLEEAHRAGVLDALRGALGAKDAIVRELANAAAEPATLQAVRNLLAMGKILGSLDPEPISKLSAELAASRESTHVKNEPPSLWQLFRQMQEPEARRGLSVLTTILAALGRASK